MKKTGFFLFTIIIGFLIFSCSTAGMVWDDSTPPEQSAKVLFYYFKPTSYNGILFDAKDGKIGLGANYILTFPAGNVELSGDINYEGYVGYNTVLHFKYQNAAVSFNLEAGVDYWAWVTYELTDDKKNRIWGVNLYKDEIKVKVVNLTEDKLVGFYPFDPIVASN